MSKTGSAAKVKLNSFDDLFGTEQPQTGTEQVQEIALSELHEFKGHPFKVLDDEKMQERVQKTVQRYIYLAHLSDALLDMVDKKKIGIVQGVELSFLTEQQQEWVQVVLEETGVIISTVQASRLKEHGKSDELTLPMVRLILTEPKPIERKVTIKADKISRYFPEDYSNEQIENVIYQLLNEWNSSNSEK